MRYTLLGSAIFAGSVALIVGVILLAVYLGPWGLALILPLVFLPPIVMAGHVIGEEIRDYGWRFWN